MMQPLHTQPGFPGRLRLSCASLCGKRFGEHYQCREFVLDAFGGAEVDVSMFANTPQHSLNYVRHHDRSPLLEFLTENPDARRHLKLIDKDADLLPGDLLAISDCSRVHHLGVATTERLLWHLPRHGIVQPVALRALRTHDAIKAVFRIHI